MLSNSWSQGFVFFPPLLVGWDDSLWSWIDQLIQPSTDNRKRSPQLPPFSQKKCQQAKFCLCVILFYFFKHFFKCGAFLKSFLNLLQYCFCFIFWLFGLEVHGIFSPQTRDWTFLPCIGRLKSYTLDHQENPYISFYRTTPTFKGVLKWGSCEQRMS